MVITDVRGREGYPQLEQLVCGFFGKCQNSKKAEVSK
jgi:hypothetical protein